MSIVTEKETITVLVSESQGVPGVNGPKGDKGDKGDKGEPGAATPTFIHTQSVPSDTWLINHDLAKVPAIVVTDSGGSVVEGDIKYDSNHQVTITFSSAFAGVAYLN